MPHHRPHAPAFPASTDVATPAASVTRASLFGVETVRAVLERLSKGSDDATGAMSLLLVLRTFALERGEGVTIELSGLDIGMLVTIEDPARDLWVAEMLPLSLRTVRSLVEDMPELLLAFERTETESALTLRVPALGFEVAARMTPVALPSIGLLLEAGLLSRRILGDTAAGKYLPTATPPSEGES